MAHVVAPYRRARIRRESGLDASVGGQHLDGKAAPARVDVDFEASVGQPQGDSFNHAVTRIKRDKTVESPTSSSDGHHLVLQQLAVRLRAAGVVPMDSVILDQGFLAVKRIMPESNRCSHLAGESGFVFKLAPVYAVSAIDELRVN